MRWFRSGIDDFLKRLVKGNILGQVLEAVPPSQQVVPNGALEDRLAVAAKEVSEPITFNESENVKVPLPPELAGDPQALAAVAYVRANPEQTVVEYKRILFAYNAERLFIRIYGTQIALLEFLVSKSGSAVPLADLVKFHDEHQQKVGGTNYQLREYVNFLLGFGVIAVSGTENAFEYRITQHGVEFLSYIKANYPTNWNQRGY